MENPDFLDYFFGFKKCNLRDEFNRSVDNLCDLIQTNIL